MNGSVPLAEVLQMAQACSIRCPIHGLIRLRGDEVDIINTPAFQRLRRIHQLALAQLVYPGASHSRFEHSIGVCHVASEMAERLHLEDEEKELVRQSALLHDLGHGPFSHVSEDALDLFTDRSKLRIGKKESIHELITTEIIRWDGNLSKLLGEKPREKVCRLLGQGTDDSLLRSIVSGPLDADKQDYLLRDSHFCGVPYGVFDMQILHAALEVHKDPATGVRQMMINGNAVYVLEQFGLAKYYLTQQVYAHKVRLITDQMILRAIKLGIEVDQVDELRLIFAYDGTEDFVSRYVSWDDVKFFTVFRDTRFAGKKVKELMDRLAERRLLKRVYRERIDRLDVDCRDALSDIAKPANAVQRQKLEKTLAERIQGSLNTDIDHHLVTLHAYRVKSVRQQSRNDEGTILVATPSGPQFFEEASFLFQSISKELNVSFVEVYAPVSYESHPERDKIQEKLMAPIREVLETCRVEGGEDNGDA